MRHGLVAAFVSLFVIAGSAWAQSAATATAGPFTIGAEALLWWFKDSPAPVPLITDGLVGAPGTKVLLGGKDLDTGANPGFRVTAGYAVTDRWGIEGGVFYIPTRSTSKPVSSSGKFGSTDLILPYIDASSGEETGTEISFAPIYRGSARETLTNNLLGAELNGAWALTPAGAPRVELLAGFRYLRLHENYRLDTSSPFIPPNPQDIWDTTDEFDTRNNFYGVQLGARARFDWGPVYASGTVKVGLGAMRQSVDISGSLVTNDYTNFGPTQTFAGAYFAQPSNIGTYTRTAFAVVPELGANLGYQITPRVSIFAGYTFLYVNSVVRPGNQIDRTLNATQTTAFTENPSPTPEGPARPTFKFKTSDFWAQGLNVGLAFRF
jgi:hypothetical protein